MYKLNIKVIQFYNKIVKKMYDYAFLPIRRYIISPTIGRRPTTSNQIILLTKGMLDPKI